MSIAEAGASGSIPAGAFDAQCVKTCPAADTTSDCMNNKGVANSNCQKSLYGTELKRTYCLPNK